VRLLKYKSAVASAVSLSDHRLALTHIIYGWGQGLNAIKLYFYLLASALANIKLLQHQFRQYPSPKVGFSFSAYVLFMSLLGGNKERKYWADDSVEFCEVIRYYQSGMVLTVLLAWADPKKVDNSSRSLSADAFCTGRAFVVLHQQLLAKYTA